MWVWAVQRNTHNMAAGVAIAAVAATTIFCKRRVGCYSRDMIMQPQPAAAVVLAVSGGLDSTVLLDIAVRRQRYCQRAGQAAPRLVVAHVNHGIRPGSHHDALFVRRLAQRYGLSYREATLRLGPLASEAQAREGRYQFLRQIAAEYDGRIATAHHRDDVVETMLINLRRGTGWRGLAPMLPEAADTHSYTNTSGELCLPEGGWPVALTAVWRPLLQVSRREITQYAARHQLVYREDETNASDEYLRNRIRHTLAVMPPEDRQNITQQLWQLWQRQCRLRRAFDDEVARLLRLPQLAGPQIDRYILLLAPEEVGSELLRELLLRQGERVTIPQAQRALIAVKTLGTGKRYIVSPQCQIVLGKEWLRIERADASRAGK